MTPPTSNNATLRSLIILDEIGRGTSTFAGSANAYAAPALLDPVFRDFPGLTVVLAHGGRGWWYDAAAFTALSRPNVWLEVSGLPPQRLPDYYGRSLRRLAKPEEAPPPPPPAPVPVQPTSSAANPVAPVAPAAPVPPPVAAPDATPVTRTPKSSH